MPEKREEKAIEGQRTGANARDQHASIGAVRAKAKDCAELRQVDISQLFESVGVHKEVKVNMNDATYEVDATEPKNNWLYPAFKGFQKLQKSLEDDGKHVDTFVSIGTGQAIDGIGANEIFAPKKVVLTDNNSKVIAISDANFKMNSNGEAECVVLEGSLCKPLRDHGITADVIYANLPNVPKDDSEAVMQGMNSATFVDAATVASTPEKYQRYLLGLQYAFLKDAVGSLNDGGCVVVNLGGRVPVELVQDMFQECGYSYKELYTMFKLQSQPEEVLTGYAEAELQHGVTFDFYRYDDSFAALEAQDTERISATQLKALLAPFRVSATEGLALLAKGEKIGHVVHLLRGQKTTK